MSPGESALCHTISKLALFYDPIMLIHEHRNKDFMLENPQRLIQTIDLLKSSRVANRCVLRDVSIFLESGSRVIQQVNSADISCFSSLGSRS